MTSTSQSGGQAASPHPFDGRLSSSWPDPRLAKIIAGQIERSLPFFAAEIQMDLAHTVMLAEQGILTRSEASSILAALNDIAAKGVESLDIDGRQSTLFWYVEAGLIERLGIDIGGKMHTGRSHNDIMPTLSRLQARDQLIAILQGIANFRRRILTVAKEHVGTIMPGYTAVQHGQPWTFGHYLSSWDYAFQRDFDRLRGAFSRTNLSPLGASALAGTSWPLNRMRTAELLGFDAILVNSRDAGFGTKDYIAEILAGIAILMNNLNALASDLYLWSTFEFDMVALADGFCGTSSIMPQKKNAWALDWTRGVAGNAIGYFVSCLSALRGSSSTDGSAQGYPERPLSTAGGEAIDHLALMTGVLETLEVKKEVMFQRAQANWATASNLADLIVRHRGFSFRSAHGIVGRLVRDMTAKGLAPPDATGAFLDAASIAVAGAPLGLTDSQVQEALDVRSFIESRVTVGSVNPIEVIAMIDAGFAKLACDQEEVGAMQIRRDQADQMLRECVGRYIDDEQVP